MSQKYVLAYDLGTGGNKAVLYNSEGKLIIKTFIPYDTLYRNLDGLNITL